MPTVRTSDEVAAPIDGLFEVISDMESQGEWNSNVRRVEQTTEGPVCLGTQFEMDAKGPGKMQIEVTEFEPPSKITFRSQMRMGQGVHQYILSSDGDGTKVDQVLEMKPKGLGILFAPFIGGMIRKSLKETMSRLESHMQRVS